MNSILKYLLLVLLSCMCSLSYGQFWKRKSHHTKTASNSGLTKNKKRKGAKTKAAFRRKSKKGPNQKTTRKPFWKSKHKHATSRKGKQGGSKDFHKKRMLKRSALKPPSGKSKGERKGRKAGKEKGASRGRKN